MNNLNIKNWDESTYEGVIPPNFIYPEIKESDRTFGESIIGAIIRDNGDWRDYLPPVEDQNVRGVESSACYVEAQQHSIATIQEEEFAIPDQNYSSRFNALISVGTPTGGDPVKGAKSIKYDGLIPDSMMPFGGDINSWDDFHSWKGVDKTECIRTGKNFGNIWDLNFKIAVEIQYPLLTKYVQLREALKRSPVPISVCAWYERNGMYYKPEGLRDTHLVEATYVDDQNRIYTRDTYFPYEKVLEANTNFEFAMYWVVKKKGLTQEQVSYFQRIINAIKEALGLIQKKIETLPPIKEKYPEPLVPKPSTRLYDISKAHLGERLTLDPSVPIELGCAQAVSTILRFAGYKLPINGIPGTYTLYEWLKKNFEEIPQPEKGCIVISPTTVKIGHVGVLGQYNYMYKDDYAIMSNNSDNGLYDTKWRLQTWKIYYEGKQGLKTYYFRPV